MEQMSHRFETSFDTGGIDYVSVMGKREATDPAGHPERLDVFHSAHLGSRISYVAYEGVAGESGQSGLREDVLYQAFAFVDPDGPILAVRCDSAGLLASVLKRLQRQEGLPGGVPYPVDSQYAALFVQLVRAMITIHLCNYTTCP